MRPLGIELAKQPPAHIDVLFTHTHFDHICGVPFFLPFFMANRSFRLHAGHLIPKFTLRHVLREMMIEPLFPAPVEVFTAQIDYHDFECGTELDLAPGVRIQTASLQHPNGATGYRIECGGKSICYVTDTEHVEGERDRNILELIDGADYVIYDSTYSDAEYPKYRGWGHSTWEEGVRLCDEAGAKQLVLFHHDPSHTDEMMDEIAKAAEKARPGGIIVAKEGMVLRP
jgi:phosphoribosyl 1,2-cyclic phosphodiesterase